MKSKLKLLLASLFTMCVLVISILFLCNYLPLQAKNPPANAPDSSEYFLINLDEVVLNGEFNPEDKVRKVGDFRKISKSKIEWDVEIIEKEYYRIDFSQLNSLPCEGPLSYEPASIPGNLKIFCDPEGNISFDYSPCEGISFKKSLYNPKTKRKKIWSLYTVGDPGDPTNSDYTYSPPRVGSTIMEVYGTDILKIYPEGYAEQNNFRLILEVNQDGSKSVYAGIVM